MTEAALPEWVKKKKQENNQRDKERADAEERCAKNEKIVQYCGPEFWRQLLRGLELNAIAASEHLHVRATVSPHSEGAELGPHRVQVALESLSPRTNYFDISLKMESHEIVCSPREGAPYRIDLVVDARGQVLASSWRRGTYASAEQLAEDIMRELVESLGV